MQTTCQVNFCF